MAYKGIVLEEKIKIDEIFSFLYYEIAKDYNFKGESHDFWELVYVDQGCIYAIRDQQEIKLSGGEVIIHQPGEFHGLRANCLDNCNVFIISFSSNSKDLNVLRGKTISINNQIQKIFYQLYQAGDEAFEDCSIEEGILRIKMKSVEDIPFAGEQVIKLYLELLLIQLIRQEQFPKVNKVAADMLSSLDTMKEIDDLLLENLNIKNHLEFLAMHLGISKRKIQYLVREKQDMSVNAYIRVLKIERAKTLLRKRKMTVTEIAELLGYSSVHYFSYQFKQVCNMTPTEYAKTIKYKGHGLTFYRDSNK